jgi:hypothetical protein
MNAIKILNGEDRKFSLFPLKCMMRVQKMGKIHGPIAVLLNAPSVVAMFSINCF